MKKYLILALLGPLGSMELKAAEEDLPPDHLVDLPAVKVAQEAQLVNPGPLFSATTSPKTSLEVHLIKSKEARRNMLQRRRDGEVPQNPPQGPEGPFQFQMISPIVF